MQADLTHSDRQTDRQTDRHDEAHRRFSWLLHAPIRDWYYVSGAERNAVVTALTQHLTLRLCSQSVPLTTRTQITPPHCQLYRFPLYSNIQNTKKRLLVYRCLTKQYAANIVAECVFGICTSLILLMHKHTHTHMLLLFEEASGPSNSTSPVFFYTQHNKTQCASTTCRPIRKCWQSQVVFTHTHLHTLTFSSCIIRLLFPTFPHSAFYCTSYLPRHTWA